MPTTPLGIWTPDDGDDWDLTVDMAASAISTDTIIAAQRNSLRGTASGIPTAGVEGRTYYATDTNRSWFDDGSNWISNDTGMYLIRPTSAAGGGSIQADGSVAFSGATSVSLNGVFTSRFQSYRIVAKVATSPAGSINFRFRTAGTDNSGSNYAYSRNYIASSSTNAGTSATSTNAVLQGVPGTAMFFPIDVYDPAGAAVTHFSANTESSGGTTPSSCSLSGTFTATTAFDGITLFHASQNISGTIRVYGYA